MFSIREIPLQNMQDAWSKLYACMVSSLIDVCGKRAEGTVRFSIRRMAEKMGQELRGRIRSEGGLTNLLSLYFSQPWFFNDPRFCVDLLHASEQVWLMEVRTCPLSDVWRNMGCAHVGALFCEEYQHGLLAGFTDDVGQVNLSRHMTCLRDNHCRFSCYYRPANVLPEERMQSFTSYEDKINEGGKPSCDAEMAAHGIGELCVRSYSCLLRQAEDDFGAEGIRGIVLGLRKAANYLCEDIASEAKRTLNPCDLHFAQRNFPLSLNSEKDPLWEQYSWSEAQDLFQINLLDTVAASMGLSRTEEM